MFSFLFLLACQSESTDPQTNTPAASQKNETVHTAKKEKTEEKKSAVPEYFEVLMKTTKGDIVLEVHRDWAPLGVSRFYDMVEGGFFNDGIAIFRGVPNFVVQFGIHGDPSISKGWKEKRIQDDPVKESNLKGYLTFATAGKNTRTTHRSIKCK